MTTKFNIGDKLCLKSDNSIGFDVRKILILDNSITYTGYSVSNFLEQDLELYTKPKKTEIRYQYVKKFTGLTNPSLAEYLYLDDEDFKRNNTYFDWFKKIPTPIECEV